MRVVRRAQGDEELLDAAVSRCAGVDHRVFLAAPTRPAFVAVGAGEAVGGRPAPHGDAGFRWRSGTPDERPRPA
ncbi:hypothetical protein FHS29_002787 [Saccharothrix tamanrassetensis]|uniref:Uncharacterized protein n=1 Tax=Saccharothrix tamanrassetensis TaxID=1051531 RepID=A0A841CFU7_9PSEU|nr:hypothetical protein [Saccharothrix tamanrassetensis]MBB5956201.1 hypothetical protein [Saccharothrix tamanrassetensis]